MPVSKKNGNQFRLKDRSMGGKGVGHCIVFCSTLLDGVTGTDAVTHFRTVSIDGYLARAVEFGQTRKAGTDYPEARQGIDGTEVVHRWGYVQVMKEVQPMCTVGSIVAFSGRAAQPGEVSQLRVSKG